MLCLIMVVWLVMFLCFVRIVIVVCMLWIFLGLVFCCIKMVVLLCVVEVWVLVVENMILFVVVSGFVVILDLIMLWFVLGLICWCNNLFNVCGFICNSVFWCEIILFLVKVIVICIEVCVDCWICMLFRICMFLFFKVNLICIFLCRCMCMVFVCLISLEKVFGVWFFNDGLCLFFLRKSDFLFVFNVFWFWDCDR